MSNSSLANYTKISPNKNSPRNHVIDTITIHCTAGHGSVETFGSMFANSARQASCNYAIGDDGRILLCVEEKDRSWCSSSPSNDNRAITIECSSDAEAPNAINDKVYASLIKLLADICKRNGIKELKWKADKSLIGKVDQQNMTVHRWFANKSCPGDYIYGHLKDIATSVNKSLISNSAEASWCDTTNPFTKKIGETYQFASRPSAVRCGTPSVFKQIAATNSNGTFYTKFVAENCGSAGFYLKGKLQCIGTVVSSNQQVKKSVDQIAKEVIAGNWGNGNDRAARLKAAGYNPTEIQARVNTLLR